MILSRRGAAFEGNWLVKEAEGLGGFRNACGMGRGRKQVAALREQLNITFLRGQGFSDEMIMEGVVFTTHSIAGPLQKNRSISYFSENGGRIVEDPDLGPVTVLKTNSVLGSKSCSVLNGKIFSFVRWVPGFSRGATRPVLERVVFREDVRKKIETWRCEKGGPAASFVASFGGPALASFIVDPIVGYAEQFCLISM